MLKPSTSTAGGTLGKKWRLKNLSSVQVASQAMDRLRPIAPAVLQACVRDSLNFNPTFGAGQDAFDALQRLVDRVGSFLPGLRGRPSGLLLGRSEQRDAAGRPKPPRNQVSAPYLHPTPSCEHRWCRKNPSSPNHPRRSQRRPRPSARRPARTTVRFG